MHVAGTSMKAVWQVDTVQANVRFFGDFIVGIDPSLPHILHAFIKKAQKTPAPDLETPANARRRLKMTDNKHRGSTLDAIEGIGEKRRNLLLRKFRSVAAIREADLAALRECLPQPAAQAVYDYFHSQE